VREGDDLAFTGFPIGGVLGFSPVTHRATVSSITAAALPSPSAQRLSEQAIRGLRGGTFDIFQLDATAYPGNSGGPLFHTETGELMGVVNMVLIKGTRESALSQPSGISYAIPSRYVKELLDKLR
jgi:S1-C subfamily serine protease